MNCPKCNSKMVLLFISYACDRCDNKNNSIDNQVKYCYTIINPGSPGSNLFFFENLEKMKSWKANNNIHGRMIQKPLTSNHSARKFTYDSYFGDNVIVLPLEDDWIYI